MWILTDRNRRDFSRQSEFLNGLSMIRQFLRLIALFVLSVLLVSACSVTLPTGVPTVPVGVPVTPLRVAYRLWLGYLPLTIAQEKGFFTQQGVKVDLIFDNSPEATALQMGNFAAGKIDGLMMALGNIVTLSHKTQEMRIVAVSDESDGADVVVANPTIRDISDLKGKRIGVGLGGFGELLVSRMLQLHGMTDSDVVLVKADAAQVPDQLKTQTIQAGQTWEPHASQSLTQGDQVIFSSRQTPGLIPDVVAFSSQAVRDRPEDIKAFLKAWFQAVDYWKAHPTEGNALIAKALKLDPKTVSLKGIRLLGLQENQAFFTPGNDSRSLHQTTKLYSDFFVRTGTLSKPVAIDRLLDPTFLPSLAQGS